VAEHLGYGWLEQVPGEDRDRVRDAWRAAVQTGAPLDVDLRIRDRAGATRWFKTRAIPVRNEHGAVTRWYGTHTDVDDLVHVAETGPARRDGDAHRTRAGSGESEGA
jgi:PAS domain-containing protein